MEQISMSDAVGALLKGVMISPDAVSVCKPCNTTLLESLYEDECGS